MIRLSPRLLEWKLGLITNSEAKRWLFARFFAGMPEREFNDICLRYFRAAWPRIIRKGAVRAVHKHLAAGDTVVIVSASPESWVRPFADALGIDTVIATEVAVNPDGTIADHFASPNCHGPEKVRRLSEIFGDKSSYHLTSYGDSRGDREMLALADDAYYKPFRK